MANQNIEILYELANKISKTFDDETREKLGLMTLERNLFDFYFAINDVFTEENNPLPNDQPYYLVSGLIGAGKSTLIAYLLGYNIVPKEIGTKYRQKVFDYESDNVDGPEISHSKPSNKNIKIYKNFIDTRSVFVDGVIVKSCIGINGQIVVNQYKPEKIVIVINASALESEHTLLRYIEELLPVIPKIESYHHILFAISHDRINITNKPPSIDEAICYMKELRNEWIPKTPKFEKLRQLDSWIDEPDYELLNGYKGCLFDFQKKIEILNIMQHNIVLIDFSSDTTKTEIETWLHRNSETKLSISDLHLENPYDSRGPIIRNIVHATLKYFETECEPKYNDFRELLKTLSTKL